MIFRNVELHNIAEVDEQWNGTVLPRRVPEAVRACLNPSARARCMACANAEIRFVSDGPARITLASGEGRRWPTTSHRGRTGTSPRWSFR